MPAQALLRGFTTVPDAGGNVLSLAKLTVTVEAASGRNTYVATHTFTDEAPGRVLQTGVINKDTLWVEALLTDRLCK